MSEPEIITINLIITQAHGKFTASCKECGKALIGPVPWRALLCNAGKAAGHECQQPKSQQV